MDPMQVLRWPDDVFTAMAQAVEDAADPNAAQLRDIVAEVNELGLNDA